MNFTRIKEHFKELGFVQNRLAKDLKISRTVVSNFLAGRRDRIRKRDFKNIYRWLVDHNVIIIKPRPKHDCPACGKPHTIKKNHDRHQELLNAEK
ncbi:MAG: helix-turn-helix transcriptional regulator [Bacteroidota bacterium]|jgi:transcriptional regulator with XRE-family HTH domain